MPKAIAGSVFWIALVACGDREPAPWTPPPSARASAEQPLVSSYPNRCSSRIDDCVLVHEGDPCVPCPCENAALSRRDLAAYQVDYADFVKACPKVDVADCKPCPSIFSAHCSGGTCRTEWNVDQPEELPSAR